MKLRVGVGHEWKKYRVFNKDTGEKISYVIAGDDETGYLERYLLKNGKPYIVKLHGYQDEGHLPTEIIKINFEFRKVA